MGGTALELARTGIGLRNLLQCEADPVVRRGIRVAGVRQLVQAALTLAAPELRVLGVLTDGLHAVSMVGVAAASRRYRRPAWVQAGLAAALFAAELWVLSEAGPELRDPDRRHS